MVPNPHLSRAVLTGVAHYRNLSELTAVANNLPALAEELRSNRAWGLPSGHCAVVEDPLAVADLLDPVVEAAQEATDTFLFYYAGHGLVDPRRGELHLALVGSDPQRMYTAVPYALVRDALLDSRAARRIVILDCCYSGRALGQMANPASAVVDEASAEGTYVLAAAAENRTALAPPGEQYTAFTGELLDIIRRGITGGRPLLDLDSIYRQLLAVMKAKGLPFPQKRDRNTAGQLTLLRNQAFQRSAKDFGISGPGQLRERLGPILPSAAGVQGIEPTTGVMPESLGIETKGGIFTKIIERGTPVPTKRSEIFTTADDSQGSIKIKVFRGDYKMAAHNMSLGVFEISGIPPMPRGVPQIEVTFHIDIYGVFKVSAKDLSTGRIVNAQLQASLGVTR